MIKFGKKFLIVQLLFFSCVTGNNSSELNVSDIKDNSVVDGGGLYDISNDIVKYDDGVFAGYWDQTNRIMKGKDFEKCNEIEVESGFLRKKAEYYDWVAKCIHLINKKDYSLVHNVVLKEEFPERIISNPNVEVVYYDDSDNHGLWSSLYVASQVFRYLSTGSSEAFENLSRSYKGLYNLFKISGAYGLPARDYRDNSIDGYECPSELLEYKKPVNRQGNTYVFIDEDGCLMFYDESIKSMVYDNPKVCVGREFANMCFKRNTSKDEISGHLFVSSIIYRFIKDDELRRMAAEILTAMAMHLAKNEYVLRDYDGMKTKYGSFFALSLDEVPGFNALGALAVIRAGLVASNSDFLKREYYECLLQEKGKKRCIEQPIEYDSPRDYREYIKEGLGIGGDCKSINFDNVNMVFLNYYTLLTMIGEKEVRKELKRYFLEQTRGPDGSGRSLWNQYNPHFNFILLSLLEPDDGVEGEVVRQLYKESICSLKLFPESNVKRFINNFSEFEPYCEDSSGNKFTKEVIPVDKRCPCEFVWWKDPYKLRVCEEDKRFGYNPAGYLLPYWMGRYFGFISEDD